jgi:hypothetical protein
MLLSNMTDAVTQTVNSFQYKNVRMKSEDLFYWGTKNQDVERRNGKAPRILDFGNRCLVSLTVRFNYNPENIACRIPDGCDEVSTKPDANRNTPMPDMQRTPIVQP